MNRDIFWQEQAGRIDWLKPFNKVSEWSFAPGDIRIKWFDGGKLNVSVNCVDRWLKLFADRVAIIWEPDDPKEPAQKITYAKLEEEMCRFTSVLRAHGVKKGDRVILYMPMIPEAAYAMLACTRIGAIHSVVFGGFSPEALKGRIEDCGAKVIITADEGLRGGKKVPLKANVDAAIEFADAKIESVIVVKRTGSPITMYPDRDHYYHEQKEADNSKPEMMDAEDPLFILYTSGSTGKPKGLVHSTAGYLIYAAWTHQAVFDYKPGDVYWCTADVGWITGHSYILYGPLCNGATTLMFEGVPNYPDHSRFWQIVDKHAVDIFYTAPTAIRALMAQGDEWVKKTSRATLKMLGTVGEPINPEAWRWYHEVVGEGRCPIMDTWWQTETGGFLISPVPTTKLKPGSATMPLPTIEPVLVDNEGKVLEGKAEGNLCIKSSWPGQARTIWGDHDRFEQTYFSTYKNLYFTGDGARRDEDGYYWITGRVDDVLNVSGHRLGTAEIESALVAYPDVAEAAVVGCRHAIKGQGIYCFVNLNAGVAPSEKLRKALVAWVRKEIGAIATPDYIQFAPGLPKTRSGKIMRRILRKIAENDFGNLGDTNTLTNPEVVQVLIDNRLIK